MPNVFFLLGLLLSAIYLAIGFFAAAFFYTGRRGLSITADVLILIALRLHLGYLVAVGIVGRKIPYTSFFEALSVIAFLVTLISSILHFALQLKSAAPFIFPLVFVFQLLSSLGSRIVYLERDLFRSPLFGAHTLATLLGYAAFAYSMIVGLMYLHLSRELKRRRLRRMFDRSPPLELLARVLDRALLAGFFCLTAGILLGGALAVRVWGRVPLSDPKILLSGLLWVIYVIGILFRHALRWSGRRLSYFSVAGFVVLLLFMAWARLLLPTLHRF